MHISLFPILYVLLYIFFFTWLHDIHVFCFVIFHTIANGHIDPMCYVAMA